MKALRKQKTTQGILVTGGFHTEGLKVKFKEAGYSYLVLSPRISRFDLENPYERVMAGKLSYHAIRSSELQVVTALGGLNQAQSEAFAETTRS